ncbi:hypothetical protein MyNCGM683_35690 [Achromobacter xylosoxidans]
MAIALPRMSVETAQSLCRPGRPSPICGKARVLSEEDGMRDGSWAASVAHGGYGHGGARERRIAVRL